MGPEPEPTNMVISPMKISIKESMLWTKTTRPMVIGSLRPIARPPKHQSSCDQTKCLYSLSPSLPLSMFPSLGSKDTIYWWFSDRTSDGFSSLISDWPLGRRVIGQQWSTVWHAFEPIQAILCPRVICIKKRGSAPSIALPADVPSLSKSAKCPQMWSQQVSNIFHKFPVSPYLINSHRIHVWYIC